MDIDNKFQVLHEIEEPISMGFDRNYRLQTVYAGDDFALFAVVSNNHMKQFSPVLTPIAQTAIFVAKINLSKLTVKQ